MWTGLVWFRVRTDGGICKCGLDWPGSGYGQMAVFVNAVMNFRVAYTARNFLTRS